MEEYEKECQKRQARAEKFGTTYVAPKLEDYLPWTEVKRLRDQPSTQGFATGIDLLDSEELAKQEARKARFAKTTEEKEEETEEEEGAAAAIQEHNEESIINEDAKSTTQQQSQRRKDDLPVTQCWDKEEMLRPQRTDPPSSLWIQPDDTTTTETNDDQTPNWVPEKIHLFAIDWAAFKQIRNKDLMAFFTGYGPTYVEWLGDLSCNVCFGDQYTAKRALMTLGQEIPSPPPKDLDHKEIDDNEENEDNEELESTKCFPDLGNMTWRFCRHPIRKIANDKYGKKGTIARVLMRLAVSTDILQDRPNSWPAPPGGFSSTKVLGPDSDFKKTKKPKNKKKHPRDKQNPSNETMVSPGQDGEHPLLGRGLSAGRQGFSLQEMEQERAKKRAKTSDISS